MLVTGRFGLKSYSLADPADPQLLDELDAEALRLQGDPPVDFTEVRGTPTNAGTPRSTFWQNKDMDVDKRRKLALLSRDPRAFAGSTIRDPGDPDPNGATNIAGVYVVSASDGGARGYWTSGRHFYPFDRVTRRATPIDPIPYSGGGLPQSVTSDTTGGFEHNAARPVGGPYHPAANFCSAHYFDVDGSTVTYAWYGEGTRFLDISGPANPTQFAYWRPDDGVVWASYMRNGYVYTADRTRGVDVLRLTSGATAARASGQEVAAPSPSKGQRRFLARVAAKFKAEPGTSGLCYLQAQ